MFNADLYNLRLGLTFEPRPKWPMRPSLAIWAGPETGGHLRLLQRVTAQF